jgi:hypothetical protein
VVVVGTTAGMKPDGQREGRVERTLCNSSVMPGQHCMHTAVAGYTLCASHIAMLGAG